MEKSQEPLAEDLYASNLGHQEGDSTGSFVFLSSDQGNNSPERLLKKKLLPNNNNGKSNKENAFSHLKDYIIAPKSSRNRISSDLTSQHPFPASANLVDKISQLFKQPALSCLQALTSGPKAEEMTTCLSSIEDKLQSCKLDTTCLCQTVVQMRATCYKYCTTVQVALHNNLFQKIKKKNIFILNLLFFQSNCNFIILCYFWKLIQHDYSFKY